MSFFIEMVKDVRSLIFATCSNRWVESSLPYILGNQVLTGGYGSVSNVINCEVFPISVCGVFVILCGGLRGPYN